MSQPTAILILIASALVSLLIYFLPTIIARKKPFIMQVFLINLLLGWTFLGWVIALIWAVKKPTKISNIEASINANTFAELEKLGQLTKQGILTDEEFDQQKAKLLGNQPDVTTPELTKKKLQIVSAIVMAFVMLVCLICCFYIVPKYIYGEEATARRFLDGLEMNNLSDNLLKVDYLMDTRESSFPKIYSYKIIAVKKINDNQFAILADATGRNGFGAELVREVGIIVEKEYDNYRIADSYNLLIVRSNKIIFPEEASDLQKIKALKNLRFDLEINSVEYTVNNYGNVHGNAVIKNNGKYAVQFIETAIAYKNRNEQAVNSDKVYAVGADALSPGESRTFTWFTSDCYQCENVHVYTLIKEND